jgi:hypothetical protein
MPLTNHERQALADSFAAVLVDEIREAVAPLRQQLDTLAERQVALTKQVAERGIRYCGVYEDGRAYDKGDLITWDGSLWACLEATTVKPGYVINGPRAWQLAAKKGRDSR